MRCLRCNYPLWNLDTRQCPECGSAYKPSDFDFVPNSVLFCCRHCDKVYYGTGPRGHLVPSHFTCVGCGADVDMDEMVLRPAEGIEERRTRVDSMPWIERDEGRVLRPWFATILAAMTRPGSLLRAVPQDVSFGRAWAFMFVSNTLFTLIGQILPSVLIVGGLALGMPAFGGPGMMRSILGQTLIQSGAMLVLLAVAPVVWVWITHGVLAITGGARVSMQRTAHAIFYASGARGLSGIPCLPDQIGQLWWTISAILMVKEAHRCHGGRATLAVLGGGFVLMIIMAAVVAGAGIAWMGGFAAFSGFTGPGEVQPLVQSLRRYAAAHDGAGPGHAVLLVTDDQLTVGQFIATGSATALSDVDVGASTLQDLPTLGPNLRAGAVADAVAALPEDVVAHRVGDFVFTHHGMDFDTAGDLWVVLLLPDTDANGNPANLAQITVGQADGTTSELLWSQVLQALPEQNRRRAERGLAPLPDPATVTHARPASGQSAAPEQE